MVDWRKNNTKNFMHGSAPRVLCVCAAGIARSPTLANILAAKGFNTRAVGVTTTHALIPIDEVLVEWADIIMHFDVWDEIVKVVPAAENKPSKNFRISDDFVFNQPELVKILQAHTENWSTVEGWEKQEG